jgi:hypothetical protein
VHIILSAGTLPGLSSVCKQKEKTKLKKIAYINQEVHLRTTSIRTCPNTILQDKFEKSGSRVVGKPASCVKKAWVGALQRFKQAD